MKVRIVESGFEGFTGWFGPFLFEGGVSVESLSANDVNLLAATIRIESVDGDDQLGQNSKYIENREIPAPVYLLKTQEEINAESQTNAVPAQAAPVEPEPIAATEPVEKIGREELEAIADKDGLSGLRGIGERFGVKATSINKLISLILQAQGLEADKPVTE